MYIPPHFKNNNLEEVRAFVEKNSFGILVNQVAAKLWATHIPLELERNAAGKDVLTGHISKGNPQWKNFSDQGDVMAIFTGPHSYISSSWYDHENVPTWNYIAVHIYGTIRILNAEELLEVLTKVVHKYEAGSAHPVSVEHMSPTFLKNQINGIIGFEIAINEIQAAYKLSQNRDHANHENITHALEKTGDDQSLAMAAAMKQHKTK